jgi:gluconate kinase
MLSKGHVVGAMQLLKNVHRKQMMDRYGPNFMLISLKADTQTLQTRLSARAGHWFNPKVKSSPILP